MPRARPHRFQCSSASRKFLNYGMPQARVHRGRCFSALQRAENSSIPATQRRRSCTARVSVLFSEPKIPQFVGVRLSFQYAHVFQCSSASRKFLNFPWADRRLWFIQGFSALQRAENSSISARLWRYKEWSIVSVLFSEPKIPQLLRRRKESTYSPRVSVLFSEPKIPQFSHCSNRERSASVVSVLFSEPKIPQLKSR